MASTKGYPSIDVGWATIYLHGDEIVICTNTNTPAEVEPHHSRNPNHKFSMAEATHIKITKAVTYPSAPKAV